MNVASLELCKELYELSGWSNDVHTAWYNGLKDDPRPFYSEWWGDEQGFVCPAYDLGYLLRKLAEVGAGVRYVLSEPYDSIDLVMKEWHGKFIAYTPDRKIGKYLPASTPEDAAAKLAIELFKQGILERAS